MKMAVGADSASYLADVIIAQLEAAGVEVALHGALAGGEADYVDAARAVSEAVAHDEADQGLLFCNTGTGVTIVANRFPGVRAALCPDPFTAEIARLANNANVLVLGMRLTGEMHAKEIVEKWLATDPADANERRKAFHRKTDELDAELGKS